MRVIVDFMAFLSHQGCDFLRSVGVSLTLVCIRSMDPSWLMCKDGRVLWEASYRSVGRRPPSGRTGCEHDGAMNTRTWLRAGLLTAAFAAGAAFAQSKSPVVTDVGASPAEERSSAGAIVFEDSMPRAHRQAFGVRDTRAEVAAIGQGVMRATLAQVEGEQGPDTRMLGGPPEQPAPVKQKKRSPRVGP
jgi:hypothetical protein